MKVCIISDTHCTHRSATIPECDLLIHAGDIGSHGTLGELSDFANWFNDLEQAAARVVIAGNHDHICQEEPGIARGVLEQNGTIYLDEQSCEVGGFKIFGTPWTPEFFDWAFNAYREEQRGFERGPWLADKYAKIPHDTQILICHSPPYDMHDLAPRGVKCGSKEMNDVIYHLDDLRLYACGHIHKSRGHTFQNGTHFVNACMVNEAYQPVHQPIVVEL